MLCLNQHCFEINTQFILPLVAFNNSKNAVCAKYHSDVSVLFTGLHFVNAIGYLSDQRSIYSTRNFYREGDQT